MCGICGMFDPSGTEQHRRLVKKMTNALAHRGPDGQGVHIEGPIALGHARLAIVDLVTGDQPLCNEDGTLWISFNGEVFNYQELREDLQAKGHIFRTNGDTETIVHGYEEYGSEIFRKMNGQWAVALWNSKKGELLLCRDRTGICPLYYAREGRRLLFASEIKSLFVHPELSREFDPAGLAETFTFWSNVAPRTVFKSIQEVAPGTFLRIKDNSIETEEYWDYQYEPPQYLYRETITDKAEQLSDILTRATRLRFTRSDVPVAAYLSGGIDSSVTTAIIRRVTDAEIKTFSLRFSDNEFDEGSYQNEMVKRLGTDHNVLTVSYKDIAKVFPKVIEHTEKPVLRTAPAPMFLLSRMVKEQGYKVVVTGEGSDEMLGGYDIYREALVRNFIGRNPDSSVRADITKDLYPWLKRNPADAPAFARSFFSQGIDLQDPAISHRPRWNTAGRIQRMFNMEMVEQLSGFHPDIELLDRMPAAANRWHPLARAQWLECKTLLPGYLLTSQGDRMLMANGVEGRFPFLDPELIDFSVDLDPSYKIMGLEEKYLIKYAFRDILPESILKRPKQPYRAPDAGSFFGEPVEWIDEVTSPGAVKDAGVFNPAAVQALVGKCRKKQGKGMSNFDNMAITAVLSTQLLHRQTGRSS